MILIVGSVVSIVRLGSEAEEDLIPETPVDVTVKLVYSPSARPLVAKGVGLSRD